LKDAAGGDAPAAEAPDGTPYRPIPCILHERLEFAALRGIPLWLTHDQDGGRSSQRVRVLDVFTRDGAEWLRYADEAGNQTVIRLDRIVEFQERPL
jgi:transcriptional antiterminator Rof (Rho-off)